MAKDTISLTVSSTTKELKLARGQNGACMFKSYEQAQDSQNHTVPFFEQKDWSGGMGEGNLTSSNRFSTGSCIDPMNKGQICLGAAQTHSTLHTGNLASASVAFCTFGTTQFMVTLAGLVYSWGGTHWDYLANISNLTDAASCSLCVHGGYMFLSRGSGYPYLYSADGTTWTTATMTDHHANGFLTAPSADGMSTNLWKFSSTNQIASSATGLNGTEWTTPTYIGTASDTINSIFLHNGLLLVGTNRGLYQYEPDGATSSLVGTDGLDSISTSAFNFMYPCSMNGSTYFGMHKRMAEITSGNVFRYIEPLAFSDNTKEAPFWCKGLVTDGRYLYALGYTSTGCIIYKGRDNGQSWGWTPWATCDSATIYGFISISSYGEWYPHRLWWGELDSGPLYYANYIDLIPYDAETNDYYTPVQVYAAAGYLETGWIDLGHRDWDKVLDSVVAECRGDTAAGITVTISYYLDESTIVQIDTAYAAATAGTKKYVDTAPVSAKKVKFRIALASNNTAKTPIVKYVAAYGSIRPPRVRFFEFTCYAEGGQTGMSLALRDFLVTCRDATTLVTLIDRFGASHSVRILPGYPIEEELGNLENKQTAVVLHVKAEKVDWS
jgi:hypothetical protein